MSEDLEPLFGYKELDEISTGLAIPSMMDRREGTCDKPTQTG